MKQLISFSIVIPLYNKEKYIAETIRSVLNQSYQYFEIIVINDSSTDSSVSIVNTFSDSRLSVFTIPNSGVSYARNFGITKTKYEYISFLDADDVWDKDYLLNIANLIRSYPNAAIYSSGYHFIENEKTHIKLIKSMNIESKIIDYFKESVNNGLSVCLTSATCVKKSVFSSIPGFRIGIKRGEDIDVWLRIALNHEVAFCNKDLLFYRTSLENSLSRVYTNSRDDFPYLEWLGYHCNSRYYLKYVILAIYINAKQSFMNKDYEACYNNLKAIKNKIPQYKLIKRLFLLIVSKFLR